MRLEDLLIPCPFKYLTGCDCPGCGIQRSIISALRGDISESFIQHPAGVPIMLLSVFFVLNLKFKFNNANKVMNYTLIIIGIVSLINWVVRMADQGSCCL